MANIQIPTSLNVRVTDCKDWGSKNYREEPYVTEFTLYWGDSELVTWTVTDEYSGAHSESFIEEQVAIKLKELWKI